jgi:hypothetical protein
MRTREPARLAAERNEPWVLPHSPPKARRIGSSREALLRAGAQWQVCRSACAAMWALLKSGVRFRMIVNEDGTTERRRLPRLALWKVPRSRRAASLA